MSGVLKKLRKLKGRSLDELRVRSAQALAAASERAGLSALARLPSDAAFFRLLDPAACAAQDADAWLEHFRTRRSPGFFAGFDDERYTREALRTRFADEDALVVAHAKRVLKGRFDLLGRERLDFGSPVDWHLEPIARVRAPLAHWSRIDFLDPKVSGDKKFIWELSRHQFFQTLGRAYWRTGDERYAAGFARYAAEQSRSRFPNGLVVLGAPLLQTLGATDAGSLPAPLEVSLPERASSGDVPFDLLQPEHTHHGRVAWALLCGDAAARAARLGALARDGPPNTSV